MRSILVLMPAFAWLATAGKCSCKKDQCWQEISSNGMQHCSSYLTTMVTAEASVFTETVSEPLTGYTTQTDVELFTTTETTTASTETLVFTDKTFSTATTETEVSATTETTVVATETQTSTVTELQDHLAYRVKRRADGFVFPPAATLACTSLSNMVSACRCAGVMPATVTVSAAATTVTTTETTPVLATMTTATLSTETIVESVTETVSETTTEVDLLTATETTTTTKTASLTATTEATATQTVSTCLKGAAPGAFKANATEATGSPLLIYANLLNGLTGGITWNTASTATAAQIQNKYIWALDESGRLNVAYNVPPYTYKYYAYMSTVSAGSNWPQVSTEQLVASQIANGAATYLTGCVDSVTGELTLDAAGRKNILFCGQQLWMSYGLGEDINRGTCVKMNPHLVKV